MLDFYYTIDTEIWCDGWDNLDHKFPDAFRRYIYGQTSKGDYGLPYQLQQFNDYGIHAVFFVEPLFSARFGYSYLEDIVGLIRSHGHEVQLHLHSEWVNEVKPPLIEGCHKKKQHIKYFSVEEQTALIAEGVRLLRESGSNPITAFRAGSFGANNDTLEALKNNQIYIDCSYNQTYTPDICEIKSATPLFHPCKLNEIYEFPMSVYRQYANKLRHIQLTACSTQEFRYLLNQSVKHDIKNIVFLSHSFELLNQSRDKPDKRVIKRFEEFCRLLHKHRHQIRTRGFLEQEFQLSRPQEDSMIRTGILRTGHRMLEQSLR